MRRRLTMMLAGAMALVSVMCFSMGNNEVHAADTNIVEDVMNVKCQVTAGTTAATTTSVNMRLVGTIENRNYKEVGFEVYYNGSETPVIAKTTTVYERIVANAESGVDYNYNPKAIDVDSKYFVTVTLMNIASKNFDNTFYIKPYGVRMNDEKVYGTSRYVKVSDSYNDIINLPVKVTAEQAADMVMSYDSAKLTQGNGYTYDGTYAHLTFKVNEGQKLPSVTEIVAKDSTGNVITTLQHRNLLTKYSGSGTADTSWYDADATDKRYVIVTAADLYGFAELSASNNFAADTIYLGADIKVNEGNASDWNSTTKPSTGYDWIPIGRTADTAFAGVFDGFGDTISGLYLNSTAQFTGLFGRTKAGSTIQNLRVENSYFCDMTNKDAILAGIAGQGEGNFDTVYTSATLEATGSNVGGISAWINSGSKNTFSNCWNDGKITASGVNVGGIIGYSDVPLTLKNCLNSGTITSTCTDTFGYVGGLIGRLPGSAVTTLEDCLNTGSISVKTTKRVATLIGGSRANLTFTDVYTTNTITHADGQPLLFDGGHTPGVGTYSNNEDAGVTPVWTGSPNEVSSVKGFDANTNLAFDFDNDWASIANGNPQLKPFATQGVLKPTDTSWYSSTALFKNFTIKTVEELYGFAQLSQTETFDGWTIKLGNDITVNSGDADTWGTVAPKYAWAPITKDIFFNGTFDGQGYTISGLYTNLNTAHVGLFGKADSGSVIKDLRLENSYFESSYASDTRLGSIIGYARTANLEYIYSNAVVVGKTGENIGGLVGRANEIAAHSMTNCQFDGTIYGNTNTGGFVGNVVQGTMAMTNCMNTGTIISEYTGEIAGVGGFCGRLMNSAAITFTDCLGEGDIQVTCGESVASYVGYAPSAGQKVTFANAYSLDKMTAPSGVTIAKKVDGVGNNSLAAVEHILFVLPEEYMKGHWGYQMTGFDYANDWVITENGTPELAHFTDTECMTLSMDYIVANTDWYNNSATTHSVANAADFYGVTKMTLSKHTFAGETIKLTGNIEMNPGWKITDAVPANEWIPIGKLSGYDFAGSFDGNYKEISGIYVDSTEANVGLFAQAGSSDSNAYIKNIILKDTRLNSTLNDPVNEPGQIGAIVGFGHVDISNVYVKDTVSITTNGWASGGIAGLYGSTRVRTISNCWFDGTIKSTHADQKQGCGGIVGSINMGTKTIQNCLNTGTVIGEFQKGSGTIRVGGIIGEVKEYGGSIPRPTVTINTCLNASDIQVNHKYGAGSIAGCLAHGTVTISKTYTTNDIKVVNADNVRPEQQATGIGNGSNATFNTDGVTAVTESNLIGIDGYYNTELGFYVEGEATKKTDVWVAIEGSVPMLKPFATGTAANLSGLARAETSWYYENKDTTKAYTITTRNELLGLSELSKTYEFPGWTITLGADIVYNEDVKNPVNAWTPIGQVKAFKGTFGGADNAEKIYTISGISVETDKKWVGLFAHSDGVLKNFRLEDSFFKCTITGATYVGSVAGYSTGNLHNIYSNADVDVAGSECGGLVGRFGGDTVATMSNCWFDGTLVASENYIGGLVGCVLQGNKTISNCLNTGKITSTFTRTNFPHTGGFVGSVYYSNAATTGETTLHIIDSLNAGKIEAIRTSTVGAVVGRYENSGSNLTYGTVTNVYYTTDSYTTGVSSNSQGKLVGTTTTITDTHFNGLDKAYAIGLNAAAWMDLDYENTWAAREGKVPALKAFVPAEEQLDLTGAILADTSWVAESQGTQADPYIIKDAGDLYGLSLLSKANNFYGKTIKVVGDIQVNSSVLDTVDKNKTPEILWRPIGQDLSFAGTFGGASSSEIATISGLYYKANKQYVGLFGHLDAGSTVQNLSLKDSYFESTYNNVADVAYVGTIAGYAQTGLSNIYSNATAVGKAQDVGGLIGRVNNQESSTETLGKTTRYFTNCWFDGHVISSAQRAGGLLGELTQGGLNMTNCLFTGTITSTFKDGDHETDYQSRVGGLCGYVQNSKTKVDMTDCISTGKIIDSNNGIGIGTIIGRCSTANQGITLTDVYATAGGAFGSCETTVNGVTTIDGHTKEVQDDDRLIGYIDYLNGGGLDFGNTWVIRTTGVPALKMFVPSEEIYQFTNLDEKVSLKWWIGDAGFKDLVDMGVSNYVYTYTNNGQTSDWQLNKYNDYIQNYLIAINGFTKVYDNTSDSAGLATYGVYNTVLTKEDGGMNWVVTVTYAGNSKKSTYISVNTGKTAAQALSGHMVKDHEITYAASDGYTTSGNTVTLRMNEVWYMGNSFVFQLPNGHFIINDGGADHEFKYLIDDLYKMTDGKKPIIEAWTISHLHYDHSDVLSGFYDYPEYADKVYVEAIYINEPSHAGIETDGSAAEIYSLIKNQRKGIKLLRTTTGELPKTYRYQTGQRFYFEGVTMDVVQAQEQIPLSTYGDYGDEFIAEWNSEFNTTSTGLMFTIADGTTAGKKVYIGGDQTSVNMNWIMAAYDASLFDNVNVFVAFHHGVNTWETFTNWSTRNYTNKFDIVLHPRHRDVTEAIFQQYSSSLITACKKGIDGCYSYATGTKILTFNESGIKVTSEDNKTWEYHVDKVRPHDSTN